MRQSVLAFERSHRGERRIDHVTVRSEVQFKARTHDTWVNTASRDPSDCETLCNLFTNPVTREMRLIYFSLWIFIFCSVESSKLQADLTISIFILSILTRSIGGRASAWVKYRRKTRSILSTAQAEAALIQITSPSTFFLVCAIENLPRTTRQRLHSLLPSAYVQVCLASSPC